ncbi:hypothetical protein AX16_006861 [Volvariella volvacea WC 439]|nr:hypothetical protein AX16_006861 [Volvariella volvacea WC 439]
MKPAGARTAIGSDQPDVEGSDGERSASPISQFSPTPPPLKPSPPSSIRSVRSTTKTTRSFVQTLKGAAKAATYAIGQGKPSSSKASKAKEMDTAPEGERDITPTQHHATKAGDIRAAILAHEEAIFERVANWTPPNNDHLVHWDPLSGACGEIDLNTFLGCEFKAAAYTKRYDIRGWLLYRHHTYPNTEVYIYLPMDIPLEEMQDMRDYKVSACILKHLTNAGSETNPHWILAGDANPFIPVHRVGATDEDAYGDVYTSPRPAQEGHTPAIKQEDEAEGPLYPPKDTARNDPVEGAEAYKVAENWGESSATTYRTPSIGVTPPPRQSTDWSHPPLQSTSGLRLWVPFEGTQPKWMPWATDIPLECLNLLLSLITTGTSLQRAKTETSPLRGLTLPRPSEKGSTAKNISRPQEYVKAGGQNGRFKSKTYGSDTTPDVPQAAFVDDGDASAWAEWSVEAMRNIAFITDFGRYDMIARGLTDPSQFKKISVFTTDQRKELVAMLIQLITSLPTEATTEQDWLRSINKAMPWMYSEEAEDLATRVVQIEAAVRSTDRACDYIHRDYMSFAGVQDGKTLTREWKKWSRQFYAKYGYANTWKKDPLQPSIPQVWAAMIKGKRVKDIDVSEKSEPHQVVERMVAQWLPEQKAMKSNAPAKPTYTIRETSVVMDSYDKVMHATAHLPRKFQVEIVNTMASGTATNPIDVDNVTAPTPTPAPPVPDKSTRPKATKKDPPSAIIVPGPASKQQPPNPPSTSNESGTRPAPRQTARPAPPPPNPPLPKWPAEKSKKTPKKDKRTVFHDKNISTTLVPGVFVLRTVTTEKTHVVAIKELIDAKREAILALDPDHEVIDESNTHLVVKTSNTELTTKIVEAFNEIAAEYSKRFNKDPKYANFFAATTKIQNIAYVTTAMNKTDPAGKTYNGKQLLQTLKLNKLLSSKIFVSLPQFIGKGEYTSMLAFNVVEFGNDANKLDGTRVLIHDGVSTIMKRRFKARALFCSKCSSPLYDKAPTKCLNCNGPHPADSTECPCFVNRHDVWELRSILEKAAAERKAATKVDKKADENKEKAKDDMDVDTTKDGFDISPADVADGWSKVGPSRDIFELPEIKSHHQAEAPYGFLKTITSSSNKTGEDYHGLPIHPAFKLIETSDPSFRVAAYASRRLVQAKITHHHKAIDHPDLMLISIKTDGERFYIFNIYNDDKDKALAHLIAHTNLPHIDIIMGDFNISDERWDKFCPSANRRTRKVDDVAALTYTDIVAPEELTHPPRHVNERPSTIDFAMVSIDCLDDVSIKIAHEYQTDSDHRTLELTLENINTERTTRRILSRIKPDEDTPSPRDQFIGRMLEALSRFDPDPNAYLERAQSAIKTAFDELSHIPTIGPHSKQWWDGECTRLQRLVENETDPATKKLRRKERNAYEAKVRREYFDNLLKERVGTVRPWDVLSWTRPCPPPDYKEIIVPSGEKLTVDRAWPHLDAKFQSAASRPIDFVYIDSLPQHDERDCPPITPMKITEALSSTSNTSAPGEDHVTWEVLKMFARSAGIVHLQQTFNTILNTGIWPDCLKSANTVIIPKPGKDLSSVNGYRPIALFSTIAKLLEKIISNRLQWEAAKYGILHPNQHGGTKKHSTDDAGMLLVHQIKRGWDRKKVSSCLAFDIASFFPSIQPTALIRVLTKQGFNRKYTSLFQSYFQGRSTTYRLGEYKSESFPIHVGLGQGSAISPTLSALYIALGLKTLTDEVGENEDSLQIFVDDGVWTSTGETLVDNCSRLKHRYIRTREVLGKLGLIVEHAKTELKHFYTARIKGSPSLLTHDTTPTIDLGEAPYTGETPLKEKQVWRYLGFFLDSSLSFKYHISFYANKAFSTAISYSLLGNSVRGLTPKHKRMLYQGCIMPLMTYGFQLWYRPHGKGVKTKIEVLQTAQNRALRWITGAFRTTLIGSLESAAGCLPFHIHLERFYRRYTTRWQTTYPSHPLAVILHDFNSLSPTHASTARIRTSDSPVEHVRRHNDKHPIKERRNLLVPDNAPGKRLLETHRDRIHFDLTHPPKSATNAYHSYAVAKKKLFDTLIAGRVDQISSPTLGHIDTTPIIIFSDGSEKNDHQYASGAAYAAYAQSKRIVSGKKFAGRCTNYEAEVYGMGLGVLHSLAEMLLVRVWGEDPVFPEIRQPDHLIIAADNEAAMKCLLSPDTHAAQSLSISVIRAVKTWLDADLCRTISFIHCPAHKGIELNEMVDKDAKAAALITPDSGPIPRSIAWERAEIDRKALDIWKNLPVERWGKSSHFLHEHSNWKNQGGIHMKKFGGDTKHYAQFVRSLTAHAPIGQFRAQFFPDEPTHCPTCYVYQDRYHVMFECKAFSPIPALTPTDSKMHRIRQIQDRNLRFRKHVELSPLKVGRSKIPSIIGSYFEWLKINPIAFTFEDVPPTFPG